MGRFITDLKEKFRNANISLQFIYANTAIFLLTSLLGVILLLFNLSAKGIWLLFELPASVERFLIQPWSILTYMFMHADLFHILFNMLWLYWFGTLFLYFFSAKHFRGLYILGGISGGVLYMLFYNLFPYFGGMVDFSYLLGASASVLAVVVATACREPEYRVSILLIGSVRLKYLALFVILSDLLLMTSENAGGHIAHLGGAFAGWGFAILLRKGTDVTSWINRVVDWFIDLFKSGKIKRQKRASMKVHYNRDPKDFEYNKRKKVQSDEVDRILDKLKKSGYESLTTEEKKSLFDASKK